MARVFAIQATWQDQRIQARIDEKTECSTRAEWNDSYGLPSGLDRRISDYLPEPGPVRR
jgi:hypothetical protein